jgi:hypothetical protein
MYEAQFLTYSMLLKIIVHHIKKIATFFLSDPLCTGVSYMSRNTVTSCSVWITPRCKAIQNKGKFN